MITLIKIIVFVVRVSLFIYSCLFCAVNFYYLRDDINLIYNPKRLYIHLKQILKTVE